MVDREPIRISIKVQPNARQNEILRYQDEVLHIRIAAPPVKGKANRELLRFLSDILGLSQSQLTIEKGMTSRVKVVGITGLTREQIMAQLGKPGM